MSDQAVSEPLLRTLSPALRGLSEKLRTWLNGPRQYPISTLQQANLEGLIHDLNRQSESLQLDKPLLVIMLMGGTGVGKSSLLNALAGGEIAQASFARPTTRDPVVYYHESLQPHRLDPALQHCRLASHDRPNLEQKVIVDTPDLDSNDLANREKLQRLLPVADIVLYVGSQEKYHDKLGWELFLKHRQRRAFAFVLNKWDRCLASYTQGVRPDEDLIRDLQSEGFENPLVFRTCAQHWIDQRGKQSADSGDAASNATASNVPHELPEGEQFAELVDWLEQGLTRLEIEAIKARGVSQLLQQLNRAMESVCPPDLTEVADNTRKRLDALLINEARDNVEVLLATLEPYQKEIEHHFALERQRKFKGIMGGYLHAFNRLRYAGSSLRDRIPFLPASQKVETPAQWNLSSFTQSCSRAASERHLDARGRALGDRLLVEADTAGFPLKVLSGPTEKIASIDWRTRYAQALVDVLGTVEHAWARPTGAKRWIQGIIIGLADWLPLAALGTMGTILLWQYTMERRTFAWGDLILPLVVMLMMMLVLHVLIALLLPLRWHAIRSEFQRQLEERILVEYKAVYSQTPVDVASKLLHERHEVEKVIDDIREVANWLKEREQAASIAGLYGRPQQ